MTVADDFRRNFIFHQSTATDLSDSRMILLDGGAARAALPSNKSTHRQSALSNGVNFPVCTHERGLQENAALQAFGIAERSDSDIDARARANESADVRSHHHGGNVFRGKRRGRNCDAVALEHVRHHLHGVHGILIAIARQANHESHASQLIVARAGNHDQVLNARGDRFRLYWNEKGREKNGDGKKSHIKTVSLSPRSSVNQPLRWLSVTVPFEIYLIVASATL